MPAWLVLAVSQGAEAPNRHISAHILARASGARGVSGCSHHARPNTHTSHYTFKFSQYDFVQLSTKARYKLH
eukprot:1510282-Rhodomonas_salina.3